MTSASPSPRIEQSSLNEARGVAVGTNSRVPTAPSSAPVPAATGAGQARRLTPADETDIGQRMFAAAVRDRQAPYGAASLASDPWSVLRRKVQASRPEDDRATVETIRLCCSPLRIGMVA